MNRRTNAHDRSSNVGTDEEETEPAVRARVSLPLSSKIDKPNEKTINGIKQRGRIKNVGCVAGNFGIYASGTRESNESDTFDRFTTTTIDC